MIELPEYKRPNARTIRTYVWNKLKGLPDQGRNYDFVASIIIWFILNFGIHGMVSDPAESFGAALGRILVPVLRPAGLGLWQIAVALISGISAKEVGGFLLLRPVWRLQCEFGSRYGLHRAEYPAF